MSTRTAWIPFVLLALLPTVPGSGAAQVPVPAQDGPLPPEVQARALELLNDPGTLRLPGGARLPQGTRIEGDVAVLGGSILVGGEIRGTLLVVNGDAALGSNASIEGDVLVLGGQMTVEEGARLHGEVQAFRAPLRYRIRGGQVEGVREEGLSPGFLASDFGFGQSRFTLRAASNYSRIEGLPVLFGPIVETRGRNPLRLEAFGIWRSVSGLDLESERLGYLFRLEQALGGRGTVFLGGTAHRNVAFVEDRGVTNLEASLSTFLMRRDLRDYYDREGWSAYLTFRPIRVPVEATLTYRDEDHASVFIQDPWTLRSGRHPWRPQFRASEGRYRAMELDLLWDSRDDPVLPAAGWQARLGLRKQVGNVLEPPFPDLAPEETVRFATGTLDVRRYARVGPETRLLLRGVAGGALTSDPLPGQFQRTLGGEGSLPGHRRFSVGCGARSLVRPTPGMDDDEFGLMFPFYGCDRTVLFQAELQRDLPLSWNPIPDQWEHWEWSSLLDLQPRGSLFFNAGRGWVVGDVPGPSPRMDSPTRADVGVGLLLGPLGLYWTYPLNRRDRGLNFFVRLGHRF